jgi:hypothetical protein
VERKLKKLEKCVKEKDERIKELESFREKIQLITQGGVVILWLACGILVQIVIFWATVHIWNLADGWHLEETAQLKLAIIGDPITSWFLIIAFFIISGLFWFLWVLLIEKME